MGEPQSALARLLGEGSDPLLVLFGGPLFGVLFAWQFPESAGYTEAILTGVLMMTAIAAMRRLIGWRTVPHALSLAFLSGALMGLIVWWLLDSAVSWLLFALPGGVFVVLAAGFEALLSGKKGAKP